MPYKSQQQAKFVHAKANAGAPWAKKFVADASGQKLKRLPRKVKKLSSKNQGTR